MTKLSYSGQPQHAAAFDFEFSFENCSNGFGIDAMLFSQNFFGERSFSVFVEDGDSGLRDDRAGVEIFVDEMDGAAGEFHAVFEGLALRFEAGEGREQRRMDV